jgi:lambda repressor-like predicted transcriptional regulator
MPAHIGTNRVSRLRELLMQRGISIAELSRRSGLPYGTATRVVSAYQTPTERTRRAIARALQIPQADIWPGVAS